LYVFCPPLFFGTLVFYVFVRNGPCCRMQPLEVTASCANGNPCNRTRNTFFSFPQLLPRNCSHLNGRIDLTSPLYRMCSYCCYLPGVILWTSKIYQG